MPNQISSGSRDRARYAVTYGTSGKWDVFLKTHFLCHFVDISVMAPIKAKEESQHHHHHHHHHHSYYSPSTKMQEMKISLSNTFNVSFCNLWGRTYCFAIVIFLFFTLSLSLSHSLSLCLFIYLFICYTLH